MYAIQIKEATLNTLASFSEASIIFLLIYKPSAKCHSPCITISSEHTKQQITRLYSSIRHFECYFQEHLTNRKANHL